MADETSAGPDTTVKRPVGLPKGSMTTEHKDALAEGRRRGRIVRAYLEALEGTRPKRGRPITREGLEKQIAEAAKKVESATNPLDKLDAVQRRIDLEKRLAQMDEPVDITPLEDEFVSVAKAYAEAKGISRAAWLQMDVPKSVLDRAGIV